LVLTLHALALMQQLLPSGRAVTWFGIDRHRGDDTMTVVGHIIEAIEEFSPALVVIDEGGLGAGIVDRLHEQRYKVKGINFGNKSKNPIMYGNKRAEMWGKMKEWLRSASYSQR